MPAPTRHRSTAQGAIVLDALRAQDGFRSAQDVHAALRTAGTQVGLSTVYRHLQSLAGKGQVDVIHSSDGEATYRLCGEQTDTHSHHHHLVCRQCGRAEEIEARDVELWAAQIVAEHGYTDVDHTIELFGRCPACSPTAPE